MREGEKNRLGEFWRNQESFGPGTRVADGGGSGFIIDWDVCDSFPLKGNFSLLYDDGGYREYDIFYFRHIRGLLDAKIPCKNRSWRDSYKRYCENVFLAKLIDEKMD